VSIIGLAGCSQITGEDEIKDTDGDGVIDSEDYAPRDASVQRAEQVQEAGSTATRTERQTPTESPTEQQPSILFEDRFEDGTFANKWEIKKQNQGGVNESGGVIKTPGTTLLAQSVFSSEGTVQLEAQIRPSVPLSEVRGFGFGIQFGPDASQGGITFIQDSNTEDGADGEADTGLVIHKWNPQSPMNPNTRIGELPSTTNWQTYSFTVDFASERIIEERRGDQRYVEEISFSDVYEQNFRLLLGSGTSSMECESITIERLR
jgi:hypothetical protein